MYREIHTSTTTIFVLILLNFLVGAKIGIWFFDSFGHGLLLGLAFVLCTGIVLVIYYCIEED